MQVSEDLRSDLHDLYRRLHAMPELSMQEHATSDLIQLHMAELGYETAWYGGTGVVATMRNGDGPVVAFRADIDGLPVAEESGLEYASSAHAKLPGSTVEVPVMHACGHDSHITCAIGAATLLSAGVGQWSGTVIFLFQPGEETGQGALAMVEDGLWDHVPKPEVIFGQHVWSGRAGTIDISNGAAMAIADSWKVTVHGRGGHGSRPEETIDPIVLGAHMIIRIQSIVSREVHPQQPTVVTVGTFHAGVKDNIIPSTAEFTVNVRSLDAAGRERVLAALRRVIVAEAHASNAPDPQIEELYHFPLLYNDPQATDAVIAALGECLGADAIVQTPPLMGSEDFGHFAEAINVPNVYWFFGGHPDDIIDGDGPVPTNHSSRFVPVLEPTLSTGIAAAVTAIMSRVATVPLPE